MTNTEKDRSPKLLEPKEIEKFLEDAIPYRLGLLNDAISRIPAKDLSDRQAFEAGAISGRLLLSFLGIDYSGKDKKLYRKSHLFSEDDVRVDRLGKTFVEISFLTEDQKKLIIEFIQGVHKACAHFTVGSNHGLDATIYQQCAGLITALVTHYVYEDDRQRVVRLMSVWA